MNGRNDMSDFETHPVGTAITSFTSTVEKKMSEAPERIWAKCDDMIGAISLGGWADTIRQCPDGTEYVRADILAQVIAANAALVKRLEEARGVVDDLMAQMDWVGTGDYKTAELEKFEFEQRIAAAFLAGGE
jgi:hypothetical protein